MTDPTDQLIDVYATYLSDLEDTNDDLESSTISVFHLPAITKDLELLSEYDMDRHPDKFRELVELLDPKDTNRISFIRYNEVMPEIIGAAPEYKESGGSETPIHESVTEEQQRIYKDFLLFTNGENRNIVLEDLKRISEKIRDNAPVEALLDMLACKQESTSEDQVGISFQDFYHILKALGE